MKGREISPLRHNAEIDPCPEPVKFVRGRELAHKDGARGYELCKTMRRTILVHT